MVGETVTLVAAGYPWVCACGHENYLAQVEQAVHCEACGAEYEVEALTHKVAPSDSGKIVLTAGSYQFICPQCGETIYIPAARKVVTCTKCKAILDAVSMQHRLPNVLPKESNHVP